MQEFIENGRLVWRLVQDARVPGWVKIGIPIVVALYFIMPIDVIPDFIPGLGQLDDLGVILMGMSMIIRFAPQQVVAEHRQALGYRASSGKDTSTRDRANGSVSWPPGSEKNSRETSESTIDAEYRVIPSDRR
jgi:uncharacterized membrane protein YkvA (DUF1232 family)